MRTIVDTGVYGEYMHYGMPLALVTVRGKDGRVNVSTNTAITLLPGSPLRLVVGVFKVNLTDKLIAESGDFVVNLLTSEMRSIAKQCGTYSGTEVDKLTLCNLTTVPASLVSAPLIEECPLNIECRVEDAIDLDDVNLWIAEILAMEVAPEWENGRGGVDLQKFQPLFYAFGHTMARGPMIGSGGL